MQIDKSIADELEQNEVPRARLIVDARQLHQLLCVLLPMISTAGSMACVGITDTKCFKHDVDGHLSKYSLSFWARLLHTCICVFPLTSALLVVFCIRALLISLQGIIILIQRMVFNPVANTGPTE